MRQLKSVKRAGWTGALVACLTFSQGALAETTYGPIKAGESLWSVAPAAAPQPKPAVAAAPVAKPAAPAAAAVPPPPPMGAQTAAGEAVNVVGQASAATEAGDIRQLQL